MSDLESFDQMRDALMNLYDAGDYATALELVAENEQRFSDMAARFTFWKLCLLSLNGRSDEVLSVFRQGLENGLWWAESQFADTDLDPVRDLPEFKDLVNKSKARWELERTKINREHVLVLPETSRSGPYPLLVALHGRNGNKESHLKHWNLASRVGWAILYPQSTQPLFPGSYCWDDPAAGVEDIHFHLDNTLEVYMIDRDRIVIGGFSQGSGMALYSGLQPDSLMRGFIGVGTWWPDTESISALARSRKNVRGYFVSGNKDYTLDRARELQSVLETNGIVTEEEVHPDLGHEFPADFERSLARALEFIFEE